MPGNSFGNHFRITTFGESHGKVNGVIIDGIPAGMVVSEDEIMDDLMLRRPGKRHSSMRNEEDKPEIMTGTFNGRTTGAPLTIVIRNNDVESSYYEKMKYFPRPGHADLPGIMKYGYENWDYRGGGRFSARETVSRVAAGAIARKLLLLKGIRIAGCVASIGSIKFSDIDFNGCRESRKRELRTASEADEETARTIIETSIKNLDSIGGTVMLMVHGAPPGLGEIVFGKMKAKFAYAMMSIPGSTYFEMGDGILQSQSSGSEVIDSIVMTDVGYRWEKNYSGGILGGLTTGEEIFFKVGFKPTSSIPRNHKTVDIRTGERVEVKIVGRHDPSIVPRAVAVVEAMTSLVLVDEMMSSGEFNRPLTGSDNEVMDKAWNEYRTVGSP